MRSLRASASSCSSAVRLSSTTWRIAARAALSSLISAIFRTVRRFTTASAMRSATAAWRDIPAYPTRGRRRVSRNGPVERGQNHGHARADDRRALDADRAAVGFDERFHDGEPDTGAVRRASRVRRAIVGPEDAAQGLRRNTTPPVRDLDRDGAAERAPSHPDHAAEGRVLDRIREKVRQDALERVGVGVDARQRRLARDRGRVCYGPLTEEIDRRHDGWLHRAGNATQRRIEAALDPREVEQVADDPAEALGLAAHDPGEPTHFLRRQAPQRQELAEALERRQRSAEP